MLKLSEEKLIIIVAALSQLTVQLIANMATIIIPEISMELMIDAEIQLWINLIYLCSLVAMSIPLAKVISRYGIKKSVKISCGLLIISLLMLVFSSNLYMILGARLIQGLCSAGLAISIYSMLTEELEDEELGTALGLVGSSGYVGLMLAPSLTGFITYLAGWRMAFALLIPFFLFQLLLLHYVESEWKDETRGIDNIGSLIYMLIMVLFTIGITEADGFGVILIIASIILVPLFFRYERKQAEPILNVDILKDMRLMIGNYAALAAYFVTTIAITILTFHLTYPGDMGTETIGLVLLVTPFTMVFVSIVAGKMSGKMDPRMISGAALLVILVSMLMFAFLDRLSLPLIILACLIQGIGHGFFSSPNNKYVLTLPDEKDLPDASALLSTSKEFGKIMSSGIYMLLFSFLLDDVVLGPPQYDNALIYTNYIMMIITCVITFSAAALLFYSVVKYERYENQTILNLAYNLMPDRFKEGAKEALNLKDSAIDTTLKFKDVFSMGNVVNTATTIKDTTIETAKATKDTAVNTAVSIKDTTVDTATTLKDTTIDTATSLKDTTMDAATNIKDSTIDTATSLKDTTVDTATSLKDTTMDTASNIKDKTVDTAKSTKDTAMSLKDKIK